MLLLMMMMILQAFHRAWINLKKQVISSKKISQIRFSISKSLHYLRNRSSHRIHQSPFPPQQLPQAWDSQFLQPPPNRQRRRTLSHSHSEPPPPPPPSLPNPFSSSFSRSTKRLLKLLAVPQSPVPEFPSRCGFEVRHGGF
uniref:Uncharacterized protein n=1 Tax=Cucumis sativus TaxID=3659 RepID=A0A0A0KNZ6_CUCSA